MSNLTWQAIKDMLVSVEAIMAPPWEMLRGEVRLQYSDYAPFDEFYVVDIAAGLMLLRLSDDDVRKMVLCRRDTADKAIAIMCEKWPRIARLSREKQEIELAAFFVWRAMQPKNGKQGMRL